MTTGAAVLWRQGYRPFFLLAALLAAGGIPLWLAIYAGRLEATTYFAAGAWHAHEMLFGYTMAVLAGFLLIGTGGWHVILLAAVWLGGRAVLLVPDVAPGWMIATIDLAFLPMLIGLRRPAFWKTMKWPTAMFPGLLAAVTLANLLFHLEALGILRDGAARGSQLMLDLVILMITVMAGRLVPGYTRAIGLPVRRPRDPQIERASVILAVALLSVDLAGFPSVGSAIAVALGALQIPRIRGWRTGDTRSRPLLWILHAGYAWLIVALLLRGLAEITPWVGSIEAVHALTVGAIGCLTIGMMTRLARVHGRQPLTVGPLIVASYGFMLAAAFLRTFAPTLMPSATLAGLWLAGGLWSLAFLLFLLSDARLLFLQAGTPRSAAPAGGPSARALAGQGPDVHHEKAGSRPMADPAGGEPAMTEKQVLEALREVIDPELGINIVDLGLVYGVATEDGAVRIDLTMTTPSCPLSDYLSNASRTAILGRLPDVRAVEIELVWQPLWSPERMTDEAKQALGWGGDDKRRDKGYEAWVPE